MEDLTRGLEKSSTVATLADSRCYSVSAASGRSVPRMPRLGKTANLISNFYPSVAARNIGLRRSIPEMHIVRCWKVEQTTKKQISFFPHPFSFQQTAPGHVEWSHET